MEDLVRDILNQHFRESQIVNVSVNFGFIKPLMVVMVAMVVVNKSCFSVFYCLNRVLIVLVLSQNLAKVHTF